MLSSVEQAFVGRDEKQAPLKTPAWEATRNGVEITVLMCEQKPDPIWFSCRHKTYSVLCEHNLN